MSINPVAIAKELYYDRNKLYSEVWEDTLSKLCKKYGVSYSALVKVCKILNVPRPPTGYWIQKDFGKAPPPSELMPFDNPPNLLIHPSKAKKEKNTTADNKTEPTKKIETNQIVLPTDSDNESQSVEVPLKDAALCTTNWQNLIPQEGILSPQAFEDALRLIEKESLPEMKITVPVTIEKEHPYVRNTRLMLEKNNNNIGLDYGRIKTYGKDMFYVNVGPDSVQRTVNILQTLCNAFEKRGFDLVSEWNEDRKYGDIYVTIMGEKINFSIMESSKKIKLEKKEKYALDYEYVPTGKLTLENPVLSSQTGYQYRWNDTKKNSLEERLNDVVAGFIFAAAWKKENTAQRKATEEERKRREAIRREEERLVRIEKQRIVNFKNGTEHWVRYQNMSAFLAMVRKAQRKSAKRNSDTEKWIRWAANYLAKYKTKFEDTVRYDTEESDDYKEKATGFWPISQLNNLPSEEPYNY